MKKPPLHQLIIPLLTAAFAAAVLLAPEPEPGVHAAGEPVPDFAWQGEDGRMDINAAGAAELELLPGIGPAKAEAIVSFREEYGDFTGEYQLLAVPGIGPDTLESFIDFICVEDSNEDTGS